MDPCICTDVILANARMLVSCHLRGSPRLIEYGKAVWNPKAKKLINSLENVQRRVSKMVPGLGDLSVRFAGSLNHECNMGCGQVKFETGRINHSVN